MRTLFRAAGWDSPISSGCPDRKRFRVTDTGISSGIDDGGTFPCLGYKKIMMGDGENKSCTIMGSAVVLKGTQA